MGPRRTAIVTTTPTRSRGETRTLASTTLGDEQRLRYEFHSQPPRYVPVDTNRARSVKYAGRENLAATAQSRNVNCVLNLALSAFIASLVSSLMQGTN